MLRVHVAAPGELRRWPPVGWSGPQHAVLVAAVRAAPSILNTQPWSLRMLPDRVELHADTRRRLDRLDPGARNLLLSCGAAATNLELAMRHLGYRPEIRLLPDGRQPWHVATVRAVGLEAPAREAEERYAAIPHRHCNRAPYTRHPVAATTLRRLLAAGVHPGVHAQSVDRPDQLAALAEVLSAGGRRLAADREACAELARWVRTPGDAGHDGVPSHTLAGPGQPLPGLLADPMPVAGPAELADAMTGRVMIVVGTDRDTRVDPVQAGRATQDVLLTATAAGLAGSMIGTVLDVPGLRERLRVRLGLTGIPQLLIRLGWASRRALSSPRRAPDAFVTDPLRDP